MRSTNTWKLLAAMTMLAAAHQAKAIAVIGSAGAPGAAAASAPSVVERGGTVTGVDADARTLGVDGVNYRFSAVAATVHGNPADLQKGAQIRFNTAPSPSGGRETVKELWIIRAGAAPGR